MAEPLRVADETDMMVVSQSNRNEEVSGMKFTIRIRPAATCAALLWLAAAALMVADFMDGPQRSELGRCALLLMGGAVTATILMGMQHCRRVILEVMSYEHRMQLLDDGQDGESCNVRALH